MNTKLLSLLVALLSISGFALVIAPGMSNFHSSQGSQPDSLPSVIFTGSITILPDGQVSAVGHGSNLKPLSQSGNYYNLTGDVNATLNVQRNGSIIDGNGYYLYNNSYSLGPMVNISNVNNISLSKLQISSTSTGGIEVQYASHVSLNDLNISTSEVGVFDLSNTYYINVSNSVVHLLPPPSGSSFNFFDIGMGVTSGGFFLPLPAKMSSHNSVYNDTLYANDAFAGGVMIGSNYTNLVDTTIISTGALGDVFDGANNTLIKGLILNTSSAETAVSIGPASGGTITNNTFIDNTITIWNTTSSTSPMNAAIFNSTGTFSGNKILVNNAGGDSVGLIAEGKNITATNNGITIMHDSNLFNSTGIQTQGTNLVLSNNYLNLTGENVSGISELSTGTSFSQIKENSIYINGTDVSNGIVLNGSNQNVNNNTISMYTGLVNSGITGYDQGPSNLSELAVSSNNITIGSGTPAGIYLNSSTVIQDANINGNYISFNSSAAKGAGISLTSFNNSILYKNTFVANDSTVEDSGFILFNVGNSTVYDNYLNARVGIGSVGYVVDYSNNITFFKNYVNAFGTSFNFVNTTNSVFYGNTGNYSLGTLYIRYGHNLTFYHNNFLNSSFGPASIYSSNNIALNLSYPIGGNYWNTTTVDKFSGPNQNISGSDGINDTSFTAAPGYIDYYPLVKPWINPQAVFNEVGLLSGSSWSVTFNGQTKTSTGNSIVFDIVNGTYQNYSYAIHTVSGYKGGGQSGMFSYTGNNSFATSTAFTPKYVFKISETGLPAGTSWNVSINGTLHTLTTNSYSTAALNGTSFAYKIYNSTLYYASLVSGTATLTGHNVTVNVTYTHWAYIVANFSQAGINLTINGKAVGTNVHSFNETVPAGTYHVVISGNGYASKYDNFTLNAGQDMNVSATLSPVKGASSPLSLGPYLYVIVGVVAAAAVISGVFFMLRRKS